MDISPPGRLSPAVNLRRASMPRSLVAGIEIDASVSFNSPPEG